MSNASKIFARKTDNNSVSIKSGNTNTLKITNPQKSTIKLTPSTGGTPINIIPEFDIEVEGGYNDVYNVPAIHQLLEIFAFEIAQIQEELELVKAAQQVYCDINANFNPNTGSIAIRNWVTENPYQVIDAANQQQKAVVIRVHLYYEDEYIETIYMMQSIYADTWFGHFKYFLGFVDDENFGYLRINANGSTLIGVNQV